VTTRLRRGRPGDAEALATMLRSLSPAAAFHRFLAGLGEPNPWLLRALLARTARPDGTARGAWLAVDEDRIGEFVVGHACWSLDARGVVDVGIVVGDRWQHRGLGRRLLEAAVLEAALAGGTRLHLDVHPENRSVVRMLRDRLPRAAVTYADGLVQFDAPLADVAPGARPQSPWADRERASASAARLSSGASAATPQRRTSQPAASSAVPV
jgi:GNAT superfamily N-acetyltransferase